MARSEAVRAELIATIPHLRAFAFSLARHADRADDLVQETLVKAWDKLHTFEEGTNLKAWLFTILRNEFYSQARRRGREVGDPDGGLTAKLASHPEQFGHLDMEDFKAALATIPDDQREALILVGASGFSYEEAAAISGVAVGTVKSRVSRARARLMEVLEVSGEGDFGPDAVAAQVLATTSAGS